MRPSQVYDGLKICIEAGINAFVCGPPGGGKTDIIGKSAADYGAHLWRHPPAVTLEGVDMRGLPNIQDGKTTWARANLWPTEQDVAQLGKIVVFADEISQGSVQVQAGYMQAIQNHRIGDHEIPESVSFIFAGNRQEDRAGCNRIITPLLNRCLHMDLESSLDDWQKWASDNNIEPQVRAFLNYRPNLLSTFDPKTNQRAFCSPRIWHKVSNLLPRIFTSSSMMHMMVAGLTDEGPAAEFVGFIEYWNDMPDLDKALKNPLKAPVPADKPATMYALCMALSEKAKTLDNLDPVAEYALRFPGEFSALCLRDTWHGCAIRKGGSVKPSPKLQTPKTVKWLTAHSDALGG